MTTTKHRTLMQAFLTAAVASVLGAVLPAQLDAKVQEQLEQLLGMPSTSSDEAKALRDQIWRGCAISHGELNPLLKDLATRLTKKPARPLELRLIRVSAHYRRRLGDTDRAHRMLKRIREEEETVLDTLNKAEILDAMGRNKQAIATYDRLLEKQIAPELRNRILLRKALVAGSAMTTPGNRQRREPGMPVPTKRDKKDEDKDKPSALARFAAEPDRSPELRNQAAVILALTNEQEQAIKLFQATGEGTARFRQEVRLAEWAIEAGNWAKAQEFAWNAVRSAKLRRDRRYALTILVEAYRRDHKLDALVDRFGTTKGLDAESRQVWIDILRETGKVEEALRLFRSAAKGEFTTDMRRELLEICRETNQDQILEQAYDKLITEEPRFLEWREGLARFYLERGRREDALNVWRPYLEVTDDKRYRMAAAASLMGLGLDDLAVHFARACMSGGDQKVSESALLFLYELHRDRGRHDEARKVLVELDRLVAAGAGVRKEMADAYARLGDKKEAVSVLEGLYEALGNDTTPDTRMKLALMLSEIGEEEKALAHWVSLWRQINSIPRRRYVEERLMSVASRLGTLAKVAIRLEKKLVAGTADDREAGLLVRLYIKINDPVSATEVIEEHMKRVGKKPVEVLTEKARVFQSCNDYYNYEQVVKQLVEIDPEGRPDYLRQLAMSNMERGQRKEAREILARLKREQADTVSDEFEAGVLALAGMRKEALLSYRRGIARYPERIDTYLLLSNIQKELDRHDRSAGMFQYLAATAAKDDLFTIAVDGILNMRDGRANRGAPNRLVEWTRRVVLERVARRPNKLYLYRLVADLSEELNDKGMAVRALKAALPIAGEQRTQILRELMAMVRPRRRMGGGMRMLPSGVVVPIGSMPGQATPVNADQLMFGRRILGQAELVPPEVYLELGESFLNATEVGNAQKTFNQASQLPEFAEMRRRFAEAFELAGYPKEALRVYEQILSVENGDLGLIIKVGELHEQTGRDLVARGLYEHGLELVLNRSVFARTGVRKDPKPEPANPYAYYSRNRNTDEYDRHYSWLLSGLLATLEDERTDQFLTDQRRKIQADLDRVLAERKAGKLPADGALRDHPRLERRAKLCRRMAVALGGIQVADEMDRRLLAAFAKDDKLLEQQVRFRLNWGYVVSARTLIRESGRPEAECKKLRLLAGGRGSVAVPGRISIPEAAGLLLPLLIDGKQDTAKTLLERLDLSTGDKAALEQMQLLVGSSIYLREPDLTLMLCRHWLNLAVRHQPGRMYGVAESILQQGRMGLDKAQLRSLTEHLLEQVVTNPDKFTSFIRRLPQLRETAGADFLTREQIEKLIRSRLDATDRYVYGIEELFALLAPEDRAPVLRSIWERLPKTQTAYFLLRFVTILDHDVQGSFAEFLVGAFEKAVKATDDKRILGYQVDALARGATANLELRLQFIEVMANTGGANSSILGGKAILLQKLGKTKEALAVTRRVFEAALSSPGSSARDPYARQAYYNIVRAFRSNHAKELAGIFDEIEAKNGASIYLTRQRLNFLRQLGQSGRRQQDRLLDALTKAVVKHPKDVSFREQLASTLRARGQQAKALEAQAEILALNSKDNGCRERLVSGWRSVRHPIRALAVRTEGEKHRPKPTSRPTKPADAAAKKKRTPPPTVAAVKKALDGGDATAALTMFRRIWRQYSQVAANNRYMRVFMPRANRILWPKDKKNASDKEKETPKKARRHRGGLPEIFTRELKPEEKRRMRRRRGFPMGFPNTGDSATDKDKEPVTAHAMLARDDSGRGEIRRQLRSLEAMQLGSLAARDIYRALMAVEVEQVGQEKILARLLASEAAGLCGKIDYGMIAALLDDAPKESLSRHEQSLEGLMKNLNPRDQAQLRRLARLYAKSGKPAHASILYRWCALLSGSGRYGFYSGAYELLAEVIQTLEGKERVDAVDAILAYSEPSEYGRDQYLQLVLETWMELLGPQEALAKSRKILGEVTKMGMMPLRNSCKVAALLHAQNGEVDEALRCLEVALCKLPVPGKLRYPYYRTYFENPGYMATVEIARLFPKDMKGFA
ncbi:MAG: tetratricopeptide repeat protein, partial [Planctomycetota bacterium]